jgi:hypothetical protein
VLHEVNASSRAASTQVDIFGGWAAVGWVEWGGAKEPGLGATLLLRERRWDVVDGVTTRRSHSFLVVMNPFTIDAVIDVTLYLPEDRRSTQQRLDRPHGQAGSSVALPVGSQRSARSDSRSWGG